MSSAEVRCQNSSAVGCMCQPVWSPITITRCSFNNSVRLQSDHSRKQQYNMSTSEEQPLDDVHSHKSDNLATKKKLGPWRPLKRLSRCKMDNMRYLRELQPDEWTHDKLSKMFGVSSSAVKRILRSRFDPSAEVEERQDKKAEQQRLKRKEQLSERIKNSKPEQLE